MDFSANLQSSSVRDQSYAAIVLRAEGADGAEHLHALLQKCQAIDQTKELDRFEESLLAFGAMTMGDMIGTIGFDAHDLLHISIAEWLVRSTSSLNLAVAAGAICGLGHLAARAAEVTECLGKLVDADHRSNEDEHVSLRAIALRNLRRIDSGLAAKFVDAPALEEYACAIKNWLSDGASLSVATRRELQDELEWITAIKNRRTKP